MVLVITPNAVFYAEDPKMPPAEIQRVLQEEAPGIARDVRTRRAKGGKG